MSEHTGDILLAVMAGCFAITLLGTMAWVHIRMRLTDRRDLREYLAGPPEFVVDILKPPIFPPNIDLWDGAVETSKSKARQKAYKEYSEAYARALEAR